MARYYLSQKWAVFGSDLSKSVLYTEELQKEGVKVKIGQKKANIIADSGLIIKSQAISPVNPEFKEAKRLGLKILTYPEAVGEITEKFKTITISGAHGKSTTTAMAAKLLLDNGLDPLVVLDTKYKLFDGRNFHLGKEYFVLEADEFGAAFLNYSPTFAIITNIDREHLDFYKNLGNIKKAFIKFIKRVSIGGILILNKDDRNIRALDKKIKKIASKNKLKLDWYSTKESLALKLKRKLKVPGLHNISNALAVFHLGNFFGFNDKKILESLANYPGIWRRLEFKGRLFPYKKEVLIYDDYAHHPTEIKCSLSALKGKYPKSKLIVIFQPHQTKRLASLFKEFSLAFNLADYIVLLPTYKVAGRDTGEKIYTAKRLAEELRKKHPKKKIFYINNIKEIKKIIIEISKNEYSPLAAVLMGAGDITKGIDYIFS